MNKFDRELVARIANERTKFLMSRFVKDSSAVNSVPTCGTARCMAGHIVALRPKLAKALVALHPEKYGHKADNQRGFSSPGLKFDNLASAIYQIETGKTCKLDFWGKNCSTNLDLVSKSEAIAHIKGTSAKWPQNE